MNHKGATCAFYTFASRVISKSLSTLPHCSCRRRVLLPLRGLDSSSCFSSSASALFYMSTRQKSASQQHRRDNRRRERPPSHHRNGRGGGRGRGRRNNHDSEAQELPAEACRRDLLAPGMDVWVIQKQDQPTGRETGGTVARLLTNAPHHPRGIKVMLTSGVVGRVTRKQASRDAALATTSSSTENRLTVDYTTPDPTDSNMFAATSRPPMENTNDDDVELTVDDMALARLVGEMDFDVALARQALLASDNDLERAINYLLSSNRET